MPVRMVLADDHEIVRQALNILLTGAGFEVVGEASDGHEAVRLARELEPDIVVLDMVMPLLNGIDAAREIKSVAPSVKTILLTSRKDEATCLEALRVGVRGCVLKSYRANELVKAIRDVAGGGVYLSPGMSRSLADAYRGGAPVPVDPLSPRERQVLQLIAEGKTNKEIATVLSVSINTVETHRKHIMEKLDLHNTADIVRFAVRKKIVH